MSRTYSQTSIVIYQGPSTPILIFAQDFHITTPPDVAVYPEVAAHLDAKHLHRFWSMAELTMWLAEMQAVVDECYWEMQAPQGHRV